MVIYKKVDGYMETVLPLEKSGSHVYLRKNIVRVETEEGNHWEYDEACLTKDEYISYLEEMQSPSMEATMQKLEEISLQIDEL